MVIMKLWRLLKHPRGGERPEGRKAAKRRLKEKGGNNIIDVATKQMNAMSSGSGEVKNAFLKFIGQTF